MIYPNLIATVGKTPLVEFERLAKNLPGRIFGKLEIRNPCANVKDRVAVALVHDAEARGVLKPGMTILEATGGNTGVGLGFVSAIRGYEPILTMPETMSVERARANTPEFGELAAFQAEPRRIGVRGGGNSEPTQAAVGEFVSGNYFSTFGVSAFSGRVLNGSDDDAGASPVAVNEL
jgi:hypothetical protein